MRVISHASGGCGREDRRQALLSLPMLRSISHASVFVLLRQTHIHVILGWETELFLMITVDLNLKMFSLN
jgi:hypothetical protein